MLLVSYVFVSLLPLCQLSFSTVFITLTFLMYFCHCCKAGKKENIIGGIEEQLTDIGDVIILSGQSIQMYHIKLD